MCIHVINPCPKKSKERVSIGFKVRTNLSVGLQMKGLGW